MAFFFVREIDHGEAEDDRKMARRRNIWSHRQSKALIYSRLQIVPFQDGFPVSKRGQFLMSGSRFVASWKNASCSGWNTTLRWLATRGVTLVLNLPRPIDCPSRRMHPLALVTPL